MGFRPLGAIGQVPSIHTCDTLTRSQAFRSRAKGDTRSCRWLSKEIQSSIQCQASLRNLHWSSLGSPLDSLRLWNSPKQHAGRSRVTASRVLAPGAVQALLHCTFQYLPTTDLRCWLPHAGTLYFDSWNNVPCGRYSVFQRAGAASAPTKHTIVCRLLTVRNSLSLF